MKKAFFVIVGFISALHVRAQQHPFQNPQLSSEERARDLIVRLTLEEKTRLMCDVSEPVPRLGIKKFNWWSEGLHGIRYGYNVSVFPQSIGMAASFDDKLVHDVFNAVSDEFRAKYHEAQRTGKENSRFMSLSVWTPNINIFRDPRWGRGQETYGEDPYLTTRIGISVVNGLQGPAGSKYKKLLACAKHFAVHSGPEWSRHTLNLNNVNQRDLWETYLPAFKALVQQADVREVMCAYQRLDDEPCCGSTRLLQKILRDDWGFKYLVVSDCGAIADFHANHKVSSDDIHAAAKGVLAGTDVECGWGYAYNKLPQAVDKGLINEKEIDERLLRVLVYDDMDASLTLNIGREFPVNYSELISKLKGIDEVIFAGGISPKLEGEEMPIEFHGFKGGDRTNIELPGSQRKCLQALKKAGKKIVFVNCSGAAMALTPETESCDAILQAWYGGQSGGQAVADVLFGDYNPSGKLPVTFYKHSDQLGDFEDYTMKGRTYRFMNDALFPFGYGLSYAAFTIAEARLSKSTIKAGETIQLTIPVTNTSKRSGAEVVQVYVRKVNDNEGPIKTLKGFKRVEIPAGKTQQVVIELTPSSFEFYDAGLRKMAVVPGEYEFYYGTSSDAKDVRTGRISILP